jgi:dATP pyrophosphohydrolase
MQSPKYKRPESVLVVVYSRDGHVLMLRRTVPADFWQSVTGSLEWGETPAQAARRELEEETGLDAGDGLVDAAEQRSFPILPAWRARYAPDVSSNLEHWFYFAVDRPMAVRVAAAEHSEYRWLPWREAAALASSYTNRDAITALAGSALPNWV